MRLDLKLIAGKCVCVCEGVEMVVVACVCVCVCVDGRRRENEGGERASDLISQPSTIKLASIYAFSKHC